MTRRPFWPGQSGRSTPRGFPGDGHHDDDLDDDDDVLAANSRLFSGPRRAGEPVVQWRRVEHPLYVDAPWRQPDRDYRGTDVTEVLTDDDLVPDPGHADDFDPGYTDDVDGPGHRDDRSGRRRRLVGHADDFDPDYTDDVGDLDDFDGYGYDDDPGPRSGTARSRSDSGRARGGRGRGGDDELSRPAWKTDTPEGVRAALLDSGRPTRRPRRWRISLAERLVASWPGQGDGGVPAGFPASGEVVLRPRRAAGATVSGAEAGAGVERPRLVSLSDRLAPDAPLAGARARERDAGSALGSVARTSGRRSSERASGKAGASAEAEPTDAQGRRLHSVVAAVYAALADPLVNADPATREQQAARFRRFGRLAGSVALAVVLIYAIFPVRTYLEQRSATARARERIDRLAEANAELEERKRELSEDETVEEIARRDYQLVLPGEESYGLLPPPVDDADEAAPTTTTTTPPPDGG